MNAQHINGMTLFDLSIHSGKLVKIHVLYLEFLEVFHCAETVLNKINVAYTCMSDAMWLFYLHPVL